MRVERISGPDARDLRHPQSSDDTTPHPMRPTITTIVTIAATIITTTSSTLSLQPFNPSTLNPQVSTLALNHHPFNPHSAHTPHIHS